MIHNVMLMFSPPDEKTPYEQGENLRSVYKAQNSKIARKPPTVATKNKIITTLLTLSLT